MFFIPYAYSQEIDSTVVCDSVVVKATDEYIVSNLLHRIYGKNYRDDWNTPIKLPVFDITKRKGGLKIIKQGGGGATISLRLEAADGKQYVLRSIDKNPERSIPPAFTQSPFVIDLFRDQTSAAQPYGALVVPPLAAAIGVYHTNPEIVYIPNDPALGDYVEEFGNTVALFEERPDDDWSDASFFGFSEDIESTTKLLEELQEDNDNEVDQEAYLKARLLDILIGDWDRHEDNWRWASFEKEKGRLFIPIPRDRDQAFYVNEGLLHKIASQDYLLPRFQGFEEKTRNVGTFSEQSQGLDRLLLINLHKDDWLRITGEVQDNLTDEVIEQTVKQLPGPIYKNSGAEITEKLKIRRNNLDNYAIEYYEFLAKTVEIIPGSNKHEYYEVNRLDDSCTRVKVTKIKKDGEQTGQVLFDRIFEHEDTREIRLFGLGGNDIFNVNGKVRKGIIIRIIGGEGSDLIIDTSRVEGYIKKTKIYDSRATKLVIGNEAKKLMRDDPAINRYSYGSYKYDIIAPVFVAGYNEDDGISLGGGLSYTKRGFRKYPFSSRHVLKGGISFATAAYSIGYTGEFNQVFGTIDLLVDIEAKMPNFVNNYFGLGNESSYYPDEQDIDFFRYRFDHLQAHVKLRKFLSPHSFAALGPVFHSVHVEATDNRFITDFSNNGLDQEAAFKTKNYYGMAFQFHINRLDNHKLWTRSTLNNKDLLADIQLYSFPTQGWSWKVDAEWLEGSNNLKKVSSEIHGYLSLNTPFAATLALRIGGGHIFNDDYAFFQALQLGNLTNLRGYRRTRFYGQSSLYNNIELRIPLINVKTYLTPFDLGFIAFNDVGRVWLSGETSERWNHGYGGGIYLSPLGLLTVSAMWGFSKEDNLPLICFGFLF